MMQQETISKAASEAATARIKSDFLRGAGNGDIFDVDGHEAAEISSTFILVIEGSLEVKLPPIWTDEKQSREEAERRERLEERRAEEEDADARKGRKVAKHCVFPMI